MGQRAVRRAHSHETYSVSDMSDIVFEIIEEEDGGYTAECLTEPIFTQADSWEQLRKEVRDAVSAYFFDRPMPTQIRLHLVRNEILPTA